MSEGESFLRPCVRVRSLCSGRWEVNNELNFVFFTTPKQKLFLQFCSEDHTNECALSRSCSKAHEYSSVLLNRNFHLDENPPTGAILCERATSESPSSPKKAENISSVFGAKD